MNEPKNAINEAIVKAMPGELVHSIAVDRRDSDHSQITSAQKLHSIEAIERFSGGRVPKDLLLKVGVIYVVRTNVQPKDGLVTLTMLCYCIRSEKNCELACW